MYKIILILFLNILVYANDIKIDATSFHNNKPYPTYSHDILFINDGIKFDLKTSKNSILKIYYFYKDEKILLKTLNTIANKYISYPSSKNTLKFDEKGVVNFIFEIDKKVLKTFKINYMTDKIQTIKTLNTKKIKSIQIAKESIKLDTNLSYFPSLSNIITNQRGLKEIKIYKELVSKVVLIKTSNNIGAGVIISTKGEILTNWHVIKNNNYVNIAFKPKSKYKTTPTQNSFLKAKVVKIDKQKDLALLQILDKQSITQIEPIKFAILDNLDIGNDVFTIGHPENQLFTLDNGIISQIRDNYSWNTHKANFIIQTKNSISSGNSGGPLVNENFELVGINTFSNIKGQNLNYAVSIYDIKEFLKNKKSDQLSVIEHNKVTYKILNTKEGFDTKGNKLLTYFMDKNDNNIIDLMAIDVGVNGVFNYYLFDENEDGRYDKKSYDKDGDGIIERTLLY